MIRRREFITLVGGAMGAWPLAERAQQSKFELPGTRIVSRTLRAPMASIARPKLRDSIARSRLAQCDHLCLPFKWCDRTNTSAGAA
jgi:hypothetical protein